MLKGTTKVEVTLRGRPGHGSVPRAADNALVRAAEAVRRIHAYSAPTVITPGELSQTVSSYTLDHLPVRCCVVVVKRIGEP